MLVEATAVMVMLYVPGAALVTVGLVVPPLPLLELVPDPQPAKDRAATEMTATRRVPQRRRRGTANITKQASVAVEPIMYQGLAVDGGVLDERLSRPVVVFEVV